MIEARVGSSKILHVLVITLLIFAVVTKGYKSSINASEQQDTMPSKNIEDALKKGTHLAKALPEVIGIGQSICETEPCIKFFLITKTQDLEKKIPREIDGFKVVIEVTGRVDAHHNN